MVVAHAFPRTGTPTVLLADQSGAGRGSDQPYQNDLLATLMIAGRQLNGALPTFVDILPQRPNRTNGG
jgi:hypothetical protein